LRVVAKLGQGKDVLNKLMIGLIKFRTKLAEESDADRPERLSFLLLDYQPGTGTTVQPVFVDDLASMYGGLVPDTPVRVQEGDPALDQATVAQCLRDPAILL